MTAIAESIVLRFRETQTTVTMYSSFFKYFLTYGPDYQLDIPPGRRHDMNTTEDLKNLINAVSGNSLGNPLLPIEPPSSCWVVF